MPIPGMPMAGGGGGPMGAPAGPQLPRSVMGGPGGPGSTPITSPGAGDGKKAAAIIGIKKCHTSLTEYLNDFEQGSPEQQALFRALSALNRVIKDAGPTAAAGARQQAQNPGAPPGGTGPLAGSPPPGVVPGGMPTPPPLMGGEY